MIRTPSYSFARPADTNAYAAGDLVANSTTAAEVVPMKFNVGNFPHKSGAIGYVRLFKDDETETNANFSLHLFSEEPVVTNGDNGAFAVSTAEHFLGTIACNMTSGAFVTATDAIKRFPVLHDTSPGLIGFDASPDHVQRELYGLLEAEAAYTPASGEVFQVWLEIGDMWRS